MPVSVSVPPARVGTDSNRLDAGLAKLQRDGAAAVLGRSEKGERGLAIRGGKLGWESCLWLLFFLGGGRIRGAGEAWLGVGPDRQEQSR